MAAASLLTLLVQSHPTPQPPNPLPDIISCGRPRSLADNITPCLYFINAWDCWESADTADLYLERTLGMLSDLMNHSRYGKIGRFWFDQCKDLDTPFTRNPHV